MFRAVVTDLDNTLYPWVDYIVPCLEAMVDSLEETTRQPRIRIVQSLKAVYTRYESNEYPWAIQESDLFSPYSEDPDSFRELVIEPARRAFSAARDRFLRPYPGVVETLNALHERGLKIVGLSDAPRNAASLRLKWLKLDHHFDALYTLPGWPVHELASPLIKKREAEGYYKPKANVVELPKELEKPNPRGLARILKDLSLEGSEVVYVGDNVKKDMPIARHCGSLGVWAEYGTYVSAEYRERLNVISAKTVTRKHVADEGQARWPLAISNFGQILEILDGARWVPGHAAKQVSRPAVRRAARRGRKR
jgi:phosphoglycolate phosphatase